jgi:Xaa-Pro aminopeptidase
MANGLTEDLVARRARVMEQLGPETMLILRSAPVRIYSRDVNYEYRQDSDLYYLTGMQQDQTTLVLMPGNETRKEILFIKRRDPLREHWEGHFSSKEEATELTGIQTVYMADQFDLFVSSILSRVPFGMDRYRPSREFKAFFDALKKDRARVALILDEPQEVNGELTAPLRFAERLKERYLGFSIQDASDVIHALRQIKTPYEQTLLRQSAEISSEGHRAGMKAALTAQYEYEVEAAIEAVFTRRGALGWGYPSIVGSGPNATTLHYEASRRKMQPGELILVDAAANYQYQTVDITRTYPLSGKFSPTQADIYRIVLAAQEAGMKAAVPGSTLSAIHEETVKVVKQGLLKLGLITDTSGDQYQTWYTHGSTHWIGMDVHDVGEHDRPLEPGMSFVIEPGIYIRDGELDILPDTPENKAFIAKVRPAYEKYKNIGTRIEDSFLLTESGLERLSAKAPRTIEEIESFMGSGSASSGAAP